MSPGPDGRSQIVPDSLYCSYPRERVRLLEKGKLGHGTGDHGAMSDGIVEAALAALPWGVSKAGSCSAAAWPWSEMPAYQGLETPPGTEGPDGAWRPAWVDTSSPRQSLSSPSEGNTSCPPSSASSSVAGSAKRPKLEESGICPALTSIASAAINAPRLQMLTAFCAASTPLRRSIDTPGVGPFPVAPFPVAFHTPARKCTKWPQCGRACKNCKQQEKGEASEWSIDLGQWGTGDHIPLHFFPPIMLALVHSTFLTCRPGCSKNNRAPFLRVHAAPYHRLPGEAQQGFSYQAALFKLKSSNAAKKEAADWMEAYVGHSDFMNLQQGIWIDWPLCKQNSPEMMAGVDEGDHTKAADVVDVTQEFLTKFREVQKSGDQIETCQGAEGWRPGNVPQIRRYTYPDGHVYWEFGMGRRPSGQKRRAAAAQAGDGIRGGSSPDSEKLRDLATWCEDTDSKKAQELASRVKPDGEMKRVDLAAMAATVITCAVRRSCPPGAVALCAAAATLLGVSAATFWVARRWRGGG